MGSTSMNNLDIIQFWQLLSRALSLASNRCLRQPQKRFFVSFENAQRFQNSQSPSFQAAKPRFTKKPLRLSSYQFCSLFYTRYQIAVQSESSTRERSFDKYGLH